jgi:hypothetical protein
VELIVGIVASVIATILTLTAAWIYRRYRDKSLYCRAQGCYNGFVPKEDGAFHEEGRPDSEAEIRYTGGNHLTVRLTHDLDAPAKKTWEGLVTMHDRHHGIIAWYYPNDPQGRFGFKQCIVDEAAKKVLLIEQDPRLFARPDGREVPEYDREILVRLGTSRPAVAGSGKKTGNKLITHPTCHWN